MRIGIFLTAVSLLFIFSCSKKSNVDITGKYTKVVCDWKTSPERHILEIIKFDDNNNYRITMTDKSGFSEKEPILYGLEDNFLVFHGQKLATFSNNFSTIRHENSKCTFKR